jgi:hypothetical protein
MFIWSGRKLDNEMAKSGKQKRCSGGRGKTVGERFGNMELFWKRQSNYDDDDDDDDDEDDKARGF